MSKRLIRRPHFDIVEYHGMVTVSEKMIALFEALNRVARTESAILVRGQSGTGKELVARAIHKLSKRSQGPFQAINCATLAPELMASELFGHARGAFTGAVNQHHGLFSVADQGSLFLDEIAELSLNIQARLLRVIQEKSFFPVGSTKLKKVDVRIISATHKALRNEVSIGNFREDLMYRIRVVPIFLPRLSERGRDIEVILWRFIEEFNQVSDRFIDSLEVDVLDAMNSYEWPGNVRELRNNVEHAFAVGEGPVLKLSDLMPELRGESYDWGAEKKISYLSQDHEKVDSRSYLNVREKERIIGALDRARGNRQKAAEILGMSRSTLWRKIREFGLH